MPSWKDDYLSSLKHAEESSPVNMELVQACSQLVDRVASLEAEKAAHEAARATSPESAGKATAPTSSTKTDPAAAQLRVDLTEALRSKGQFQARLKTAEDELDRLRIKTKTDTKAIRELSADNSILNTKLRDREHELREKKRLLDQVQDEMIMLNLQVSVAETERDRVRVENKELVDRWMKRMGQEADAMNIANEPLFEKAK